MRIPTIFVPERTLDKKVKLLLKQGPYAKECAKQDSYAKECAKLEEEISKLRDELKKCEERRIKNPDYYSVLTDPYREEREVTMKLLQLEQNYLEIKGEYK